VGNAVGVPWRRKPRATLDDVVEYLNGLGRMLQSNARLEQIVDKLGGDDGAE
jgi:hypothetical protein